MPRYTCMLAAAAILVAHPAIAAPDPRPTIALTFDDLPTHGALPVGETRLDVATRIIAALQADKVATPHGFLNGGIGTDDPQSPQVIAAWRAAGYPIGNHGWSHADLAALSPSALAAEIDRNEPLLHGAGARWFRYPFLSEGRDAATTGAIRAALHTRGYRVAAVTMSFGDYAWNDAYARCTAKHDDAAIAGLERSFLDAARVQALRSRTLAKTAVGRDISYVLLMHLGAFDARMMPRLLGLYRAMGFGFTSLETAQADPFYAAANDLTLPGPSPTLEAAAREKGVDVPANAPLPGPEVCR